MPDEEPKDANGPEEEREGQPTPEDQFAAMDTDGDGVVSLDEFKSAVEAQNEEKKEDEGNEGGDDAGGEADGGDKAEEPAEDTTKVEEEKPEEGGAEAADPGPTAGDEAGPAGEETKGEEKEADAPKKEEGAAGATEEPPTEASAGTKTEDPKDTGEDKKEEAGTDPPPAPLGPEVTGPAEENEKSPPSPAAGEGTAGEQYSKTRDGEEMDRLASTLDGFDASQVRLRTLLLKNISQYQQYLKSETLGQKEMQGVVSVLRALDEQLRHVERGDMDEIVRKSAHQRMHFVMPSPKSPTLPLKITDALDFVPLPPLSEKHLRALQEIFLFYCRQQIDKGQVSSNPGELGTFGQIAKSSTTMSLPEYQKFCKDFEVAGILVTKKESEKTFRQSSDGRRYLDFQHFKAALVRLARIGFSRPPHSLDPNDESKLRFRMLKWMEVDRPEIYRRRMRPFGEPFGGPRFGYSREQQENDDRIEDERFRSIANASAARRLENSSDMPSTEMELYNPEGSEYMSGPTGALPSSHGRHTGAGAPAPAPLPSTRSPVLVPLDRPPQQPYPAPAYGYAPPPGPGPYHPGPMHPHHHSGSPSPLRSQRSKGGQSSRQRTIRGAYQGPPHNAPEWNYPPLHTRDVYARPAGFYPHGAPPPTNVSPNVLKRLPPDTQMQPPKSVMLYESKYSRPYPPGASYPRNYNFSHGGAPGGYAYDGSQGLSPASRQTMRLPPLDPHGHAHPSPYAPQMAAHPGAGYTNTKRDAATDPDLHPDFQPLPQPLHAPPPQAPTPRPQASLHQGGYTDRHHPEQHYPYQYGGQRQPYSGHPRAHAPQPDYVNYGAEPTDPFAYPPLRQEAKSGAYGGLAYSGYHSEAVAPRQPPAGYPQYIPPPVHYA